VGRARLALLGKGAKINRPQWSELAFTLWPPPLLPLLQPDWPPAERKPARKPANQPLPWRLIK